MSEEITVEEYNNFVRDYDLDMPEIESGAIFPEIERRLFQTIKDLKVELNAAKGCIAASPADPDSTKKYLEAYKHYKEVCDE
jgi:hypothetical protein